MINALLGRRVANHTGGRQNNALELAVSSISLPARSSTRCCAGHRESQQRVR